MELLAIKSGTKYLKISGDEITLTAIDKASVYPFSKLQDVKNIIKKVENYYSNLLIVKLTIIEEIFKGDV
jgi:hypothetical protein